MTAHPVTSGSSDASPKSPLLRRKVSSSAHAPSDSGQEEKGLDVKAVSKEAAHAVRSGAPSPMPVKSPRQHERLPSSPRSERSRDSPGSSRTRYMGPRPMSTATSPNAAGRNRQTSLPPSSPPVRTSNRPSAVNLIDLSDSAAPSPSGSLTGTPEPYPTGTGNPEQPDHPPPARPAQSPPAYTTPTEVDMNSVHAPYRPPEPVYEPPEEHSPGYVPGVISDHPFSDDDDDFPRVSPIKAPAYRPLPDITGWQQSQDERMDVDDSAFNSQALQGPERPQIGPGVLPTRLLSVIHEHELRQPIIDSVPMRADRRSHTSSSSQSHPKPASASTTSVPNVASTTSLASASASSTETEHTATLDDVWDACPGGRENHREWYFCIVCGGWIRVRATRGSLPEILDNDNWLARMMEAGNFLTEPEVVDRRDRRQRELSRLQDLTASRATAPQEADHLHEFSTLLIPREEERLERIDVDDKLNDFPHNGLESELKDEWTRVNRGNKPARLFVSCSSDLWVMVDKGIVPGQIPVALQRDFTTEKISNPSVGKNPAESVNAAWTLLMTLLTNPLFKGQRGWVSLENPRFQSAVGTTIISSCVLFALGFGCQVIEGITRIGPYNPGEGVSKEDAAHMEKYMLRAWVEVGMYLSVHRQNEMINHVPTRFYPDLAVLGVRHDDCADTIVKAYNLQVSCDFAKLSTYLSALAHLSEAPIARRDDIQFRVVGERSMERYTLEEVNEAYTRIGYSAEVIGIDGPDAPGDYILGLHKTAMQAASNSVERSEVNRAMTVIGKDRQSEQMLRLASSGQTVLSVEEAYAAFSAPRESIDDGLIMQYELAVGEYPGKTDHYRTCLGIIADAAGEERPGLKTYLQTGNKAPEAPPRNDIPVGLQNIGNTCYLNSILQYLYSIKPVREAVLAFEQQDSGTRIPRKPEVERSRRFVRQLRLLFLQLYKSDRPAVRPDEELAYLAITRPEVDQIVEPAVKAPEPTKPSILDSIPDVENVAGSDLPIPSPSSTRVASPSQSPTLNATSPPESPRPLLERSSSVLGKRSNVDRTPNSRRSSTERSRKKSEGYDDIVDALRATEDTGEKPTGLDLTLEPSGDEPDTVDSPSAATDLGALKLKSPELEEHTITVPPPLPPRPAVERKDTLASGLRFGLQQDSAEVLINILTQLEMAFDPASAEEGTESHNFIQKLYSCKFRQQTSYEATSGGAIEAQTPVESVFVHPIIGVEEEGQDLYDCLAELYLKGADIEYEGRRGYMMDLMDRFPPMLYIQMRRSQYDPRTGRETKTNTHISFGQTLAMDRFLVNADASKRDESIEITREMSKVRARIHQLKTHKPMAIPLTFRHVRDALANITDVPNLDITPDFLGGLEAAEEEVKQEIQDLEVQLPLLKQRLEGIWQGATEWEYELASVYMHRGKTSGAGHYWTYQAHLPGPGDRYYKYNDELVTEVPRSEVLEDRTGSDANPALLCYVRKGMDLVDTLHREAWEMEQAQAIASALEAEMSDVEQNKEETVDDGGVVKADADEVLL